MMFVDGYYGPGRSNLISYHSYGRGFNQYWLQLLDMSSRRPIVRWRPMCIFMLKELLVVCWMNLCLLALSGSCISNDWLWLLKLLLSIFWYYEQPSVINSYRLWSHHWLININGQYLWITNMVLNTYQWLTTLFDMVDKHASNMDETVMKQCDVWSTKSHLFGTSMAYESSFKHQNDVVVAPKTSSTTDSNKVNKAFFSTLHCSHVSTIFHSNWPRSPAQKLWLPWGSHRKPARNPEDNDLGTWRAEAAWHSQKAWSRCWKNTLTLDGQWGSFAHGNPWGYSMKWGRKPHSILL